MQSLSSLLSSAEGLDFLESRGAVTNQNQFRTLVKPPASPVLASSFGGSAETKLVCSGQQVCVDFRHSVLSKIEVLLEMDQADDLLPFFLWVDTDRAGSDNLMTKFAWPAPSKKGPITILPPGTSEFEARFARTDAAQLSSAIGRLEMHLRQLGKQKDKAAVERYLSFKAFFVDPESGPLSTFNLRLTEFLLSRVIGSSPRSIVLSDQLHSPFVLQQVDLFLNSLQDIIKVFNEARDVLISKGTDPQLNPLPNDYLPLFYSCQEDNRRLRLHRVNEGGEQFATCSCKCGRTYRFHLGNERLSVADIALTDRWSPDVCFPMFFNDLVSGFIAGKSSAIYLLIFNEVLREVLDKKPVPILVPADLQDRGAKPLEVDSLIYRYFFE